MAASQNPYPPHLTQALTYLFEGVLSGVTLLREQMRSEFGLLQERVRSFQALSTALQEELQSLIGKEALERKHVDKLGLEKAVTLFTDLQYEDIIHQILEHIEQTAKDVLEELHLAASTGKSKSSKKPIEYTWLPGVEEIIQLESALFSLAEKEHQSAVQNLRSKLSSLQEHALYLQNQGQEYCRAISLRDEASSHKAAVVLRLSVELTALANTLLEGLGRWFSFYEVVHVLGRYFQESLRQLAQLPPIRKPLPAVALHKLLERCTMQGERLIYQQIFQPDLECYSPSQRGTIEMF